MESEAKVRIGVPVCERSVDAVAEACAKAAEVGDLIELRVDCLDPGEFENGLPEIKKILNASARPTILTFRPAEQGGQRSLDHASRSAFWCMREYPSAADFIDVELDLAQRFRSSNTPLPLDWSHIICSHHDFAGVPADLDQVYQRMASFPARILKIAVRADDVTDCLPVFRLLDRARREDREMIAIAMGAAGTATRILGPSRGAFLTYGALKSDRATAPGQITARELRDLYRIDSVDRQTQITGLMGLPVSHSISPHIHNAAFQAAGVNAVYIPFEVRDVGSFLKRMINPRTREIAWNLRGLSVTAPHKRAVMDHLDWIEPAAQEIGAVNTIVVAQGALHGYNTDAVALIRPLLERTGELQALQCAVIGAGGAASAALWCIRQQGSSATVFGRNIDKASALAQRFGFGSKKLDGASFVGFDVVINATPLGTAGQLQDKTAATNDQLRGARLAYDLVYNPIETRFSREARQAGCETLGGLSMLLAQAAEQFKLWMAADAPDGVMSAAAARALADDRLNRRLQSEARPNSGSEIRNRESKTANGR